MSNELSVTFQEIHVVSVKMNLFSWFDKLQTTRAGYLFTDSSRFTVKGCGQDLELVIALDTSSADEDSFKDQKNIAKRIAHKLVSEVPKYKIHVVLYDGGKIPSRLITQNDSINAVDRLIDFIPQIGGARRTEKALALAANLFKKQQKADEKQRAFRASSSKVLVLFATGPQQRVTNGVKPKDAKRELQDLGVKLLAVGTKYTPLSLLQEIGQEFAFRFPNSGMSTDSFAKMVGDKTCESIRKGNVCSLL